MSVEFEDTGKSLRATLDETIERIEGDIVTLRKLLELIGEQGLLLLCALLTIPFLLPVSIPGVSTVFGAAIILLSLGIAFNRTPWLPRRLLDRGIDAAKLVPVLQRGSAIVAKVETVVRPRLPGFTAGAVINRFNGLALAFAGVLLMFPLGLVPFSNTLPAFAILFLCLGIAQRDGLMVLAGYGLILTTVIYFTVLAWVAFAAGRGVASIFGG